MLSLKGGNGSCECTSASRATKMACKQGGTLMKPTFYVTTSIFYANDRLHVGHCYESVAADTLARYWRGRGAQVRLLSGTDEHGIRIQRKAASLGRTPQDWVDEISEADRALADRLGISYDDFIRTSEERHKRAVQRIFTRLYEQGDIYKAAYEGWYCQHEESYWPESRVAPGHLCPECGRPLEWTREEAYNFRLSKIRPADSGSACRTRLLAT